MDLQLARELCAGRSAFLYICELCRVDRGDDGLRRPEQEEREIRGRNQREHEQSNGGVDDVDTAEQACHAFRLSAVSHAAAAHAPIARTQIRYGTINVRCRIRVPTFPVVNATTPAVGIR